MSATAASIAVTRQAGRTPGHLLVIFLKEAKFEFLKLARLPIYALSTILFPVMFYVLFGLLLNRGQELSRVAVAAYLLATYATFGVMGASLFGFGVGLAGERGLGWLQVKQASPMPPFAYFFAKTVVCMTFSLIIVLLLMTLGALFGGVHLALPQAVRLAATLVAGSITFCAMGMAIGYFAGPSSAPTIVNLIYLPLSFCSGLWIPIQGLPGFLQTIAPFLPPFHLGQLALHVIGADTRGSIAGHWEALAAFALICLGIARIGYQRDEGKTYG
jgi:ABC-2 type transport system permease protein